MKSYKLLLFAIASLWFVSCGPKDSKPAGSASCPEMAPIDTASLTGERDPIAEMSAVTCGEIALWGSSMPKSLNMWEDLNSFSVEIMGLLYEPLVGLHTTEERPVGVLADRWETSADGLTYTFHIDPRAKWSDGKSITAEDIQYYYDVIMDPRNLTPVFKVGLSRFSRPEIVDSLTVRIVAKENHWQNFWEAAGMTAFPKHSWKDKAFSSIRFEFPVVSGPYRLAEVAKDRHLILERRNDWWGRAKAWNLGKYNFTKVRYRFMEDQVKALETLKKGDLDAIPIYTSAIWMKQTDFDAVQKNWIIKQKIYNKEPIGFQGFSMNMRKPKFQDIRVRKALAMLLNRELMQEKYMFGQYFLLNSYFPDLYNGNTNPLAPQIRFAPDSARALLAQAGYVASAQGKLYRNGQPLSISFLTQQVDLRHLTKYVEDLQAVGIDASIQQMSSSALRQKLDEFDFDMYWISYGAGRLRDPEAEWSSKTANEKGSSNLSGVKDAGIDSLIQLQKTEPDLARRNAILREIDTRLTQIMPYVLLWQSDNHRVLYWNQFGHPATVFDKYGREESILTYWWFDSAKMAQLEAARKEQKALPNAPEPKKF